MATPARKGSKVVLFLGLFLLSFVFVRPLHYEWSQVEMRAWLYTSQALGIRDPEDLYIAVWLTIELIAAVLAYVAIMKLWRWYRTK
ncbi:hypothetical protein OKW33_002233 [Paraburkholderia atlantica]|uniref:hypothetical protein n=1 Tax=Paraburkholderia atlantica TaxID=2654982 RepID=UPI00128DC9E8|nr:hypothetical protein [Paraburkholderia atlantica]MPW04323.1 hypothetical protein [Paraburkholderia atlantica]NUY29749.1 hypothetical protein [Paraburkholderia atlantica]